MLSELLNRIKAYLPDENLSVVEKAFEFSGKAHDKQLRASGEEFFQHSYSVARILTELKLDAATISAALLHDVLEDTKVTHHEMQNEFGKEITALVDGVTKISSYHFADPETAQAENWRKMILAITKDIRVILIKLADRIHNLRTIKYLDPSKQSIIASESLSLYAPFAQRLGIYKWKNEMEDLSFEVLEPVISKNLKAELETRQESNIANLELWKKLISEKLSPFGIKYQLLARPKNIFGIYKKMKRQHKPSAEIQDLIGLRLVTDTVANCYALLGIISSQFTQVDGSFTDYIAVPKINMYQSLHTTIVGPNNIIAELQIRTEEMHRRSEYGIAAHWRYKEHGESKDLKAGTARKEMIEEKLDWLKEVLEWQQELKDPREFLSALKVECEFEQIFVFTPKGKVIKLAMGATPVDFAFMVHSDVGNKCVAARVNEQMVNL